MKSFLIRVLIFSVPIILFIGLYIFFDPYRVIFDYEDYTKGAFIGVDRDYVSHEQVKKGIKKYNYNSFILGSSRMLAYRTQEWKKYLNKEDEPALYNAYGETIYGIWAKLNWLNENKHTIQNVIIGIDKDHTFKEPDLNRLHYDYTPYSYLEFQSEMFLGFSKKVWLPYYDYMFFHKERNYMKGKIDFRVKEYYTPKGNDMVLNYTDSLLQYDSLHYYQDMIESGHSKRNKIEHNKDIITKEYIEYLDKIKKILIDNNTNYSVVINPQYSQEVFTHRDLEILNTIFGKDHIYNYSGKNEITDNFMNYYEESHFKPYVGAKILKEIYSK